MFPVFFSRLHIGLEAVFGEILPVSNLGDLVGISQFILNRILSNPDILAQFAHPTGNHLKLGWGRGLMENAQLVIMRLWV